MIDPAVEQVLRGDEGERFCFFLREAYVEAKQVGHIAVGVSSSDRARLIGLAKQRSLLNEVNSGVCQWTPVGYEIANVAKEYCNWMEAGRTLPEGVTRELIDGRRVLDVGCRFGRHPVSFAARRVGDLRDRFAGNTICDCRASWRSASVSRLRDCHERPQRDCRSATSSSTSSFRGLC